MIKKLFSIFAILSMFSGIIESRPEIVAIKAGRNILPNARIKLQWLNRIDEGEYVFGAPMFINFRTKITVPKEFRVQEKGLVKAFHVDGFQLTLDSDNNKKAQVLFPYDDRSSLIYSFSLVGRIEESDYL